MPFISVLNSEPLPRVVSAVPAANNSLTFFVEEEGEEGEQNAETSSDDELNVQSRVNGTLSFRPKI